MKINSEVTTLQMKFWVECHEVIKGTEIFLLILGFYDKNAILSKESGSTQSSNLQERFGNILRIAPLLKGTICATWFGKS